jgi:hypothetical protein
MDEYEGQGGSYILNPKTGKRELVQRTYELAEQPVAPADQPTEAE